MKTNPCALFLSLALFLPLSASAVIRYVDANNPSPAAPYISWATAATNIQDAVLISSGSDTVLVTNGVYQYGSYTFQGKNRVFANLGTAIKSVNGPSVTIIKGAWDAATNGPNAVRCVFLANLSSLSGFTLTGGATIVSENGGGVHCDSTNCIVTNCVIVGNSAYSQGGGAYQATLLNCIVNSNICGLPSFGSGGGAWGCGLVNCLVAGNRCGYIGGAAISSLLLNCTVVGNASGSYAGSLAICTADNTIVYYNHNQFTNDDSNSGYAFTNCCLSFSVMPPGLNNFTNPPLFANPAAGDYHLLPSSPCINAGNNSFISNSIDLDGNARIVAGTADIGAYEFQSLVH